MFIKMFVVGAVIATVRAFASPFVGDEWAKIVSHVAGALYAAFVVADTWKRASTIAAVTLIWTAGLFYFLDYRPDIFGFGIMTACGAVAYQIVRPLRRELQRS